MRPGPARRALSLSPASYETNAQKENRHDTVHCDCQRTDCLNRTPSAGIAGDAPCTLRAPCPPRRHHVLSRLSDISPPRYSCVVGHARHDATHPPPVETCVAQENQFHLYGLAIWHWSLHALRLDPEITFSIRPGPAPAVSKDPPDTEATVASIETLRVEAGTLGPWHTNRKNLADEEPDEESACAGQRPPTTDRLSDICRRRRRGARRWGCWRKPPRWDASVETPESTRLPSPERLVTKQGYEAPCSGPVEELPPAPVPASTRPAPAVPPAPAVSPAVPEPPLTLPPGPSRHPRRFDPRQRHPRKLLRCWRRPSPSRRPDHRCPSFSEPSLKPYCTRPERGWPR